MAKSVILSTSEKFNRKEAFNELLDVHVSGEAISPNSLDKLLNYFAPSAPHKPKTSEQWVNLAIAKNDVRYYLNEAYSDGEGNYLATNGHMLFRCDTTKPEGFYNGPTGLQVKLDGKFPYRWPGILRRVPDGEYVSLCSSGLVQGCRMLDGKEYFYYASPNQTDYVYEKHYIDKMLSICVCDVELLECVNGVGIYFKHDGLEAAVMPMRY